MKLRGKASRAAPQSQKMTAGKIFHSDISPAPGQRMCRGGGSIPPGSSPLDIEIAISLMPARVARWNGQTAARIFLGGRSIRCCVEAVMREQTPRLDIRFRLAARVARWPLNMSSAMNSPFRRCWAEDYNAVEKNGCLRRFHIRFGLPSVLRPKSAGSQGSRQGAATSRPTELAGFDSSRGESACSGESRAADFDPDRDYLIP